MNISYETQGNIGVCAGAGFAIGGAVSLGLIHGIALASAVGIPLILVGLALIYGGVYAHKKGIAENKAREAEATRRARESEEAYQKGMNKMRLKESEEQGARIRAEGQETAQRIAGMSELDLRIEQAEGVRRATYYGVPGLDGSR